jgi:hypothetical protein
MAHGVPVRDLRALGARFQVHGTLQRAVPHGSGHINETWAATYDQAGRDVRYIHQRINSHVFRQPERLMDNVARVLAHAATRLEGQPDASRRTLTLVPARDGHPFVVDEEGALWRTYLFIEGARTYDIVETTAQAEAAARAFGQFQAVLADLPGARLHDTIADFHHTRRRFDALAAAVAADRCNRAAHAREAIAFAFAREADVDRLIAAAAAGDLPERVTHNDTKLNNVMIDEATGAALCVVDLDTTMPGLVAYDFGDMVRTATNATAEDEPDLARVRSRPEMFEAIARGYLSSAAAFLTAAEIDSLAFGGKLIALEQAIRFLCDHLEGDAYYRIGHPGHNLQRARAQFALVASIEQQLDRYERIVGQYSRG